MAFVAAVAALPVPAAQLAAPAVPGEPLAPAAPLPAALVTTVVSMSVSDVLVPVAKTPYSDSPAFAVALLLITSDSSDTGLVRFWAMTVLLTFVGAMIDVDVRRASVQSIFQPVDEFFQPPRIRVMPAGMVTCSVYVPSSMYTMVAWVVAAAVRAAPMVVQGLFGKHKPVSEDPGPVETNTCVLSMASSQFSTTPLSPASRISIASDAPSDDASGGGTRPMPSSPTVPSGPPLPASFPFSDASPPSSSSPPPGLLELDEPHADDTASKTKAATAEGATRR